jgi:hypothetical protein
MAIARESTEEEKLFAVVLSECRAIDKMLWYQCGDINRKNCFNQEIKESADRLIHHLDKTLKIIFKETE